MKKLISLALCALLLMLNVSALAAGKTLAQVQADGVLVMGTSPDFPPFESLEVDVMSGETKVVGIEADVMNIVAEKLGVKLDIRQIDFDSVLPGVQTNTYDIGVSGFTVTEERKQNVLFTNVYYNAAIVIVVNAGSDIKGLQDLAGKQIAVQSGTTAEALCVENGYSLNAYKANVDAELALVHGSVDAWVIDAAPAQKMVAEYNASAGSEALVILDEALTEEPYAFALAFGSEDLCAAISEIVDGLVQDGTMAEIFAKYELDYSAPASVE